MKEIYGVFQLLYLLVHLKYKMPGMYRSLVFIICSLFSLSQLFAQRTIAGKVTDCEGEPLTGATIIIKGTHSGTAADENGFYRIEIPKELEVHGVNLIFEFYGMESNEAGIKDRDTINVTLKEDTTLRIMDEYPRRGIGIDKPVIYLYPEKQTEVNLQVNFNGKLDFTYPPYKNGWQLIAQPDGTLTDKNDGREHKYLFWDGKMSFTKEQTTYATGFVVHKDSLVAFFQKYLPKMGLKPHEYNDFIVFWTPLMQKNEWNFIHFRAGMAYDIIATNTVIPKPDTQIRVFMEFTKVAGPFSIPAQEIATPERKGFTLVEWGGAALEEAYFEIPATRFKPEGQAVNLNVQSEVRSCAGTMKPFNPEKL